MAVQLRHPLNTRVGRRIAAVAVVSVLVPLALFGTVVFARARTQLAAQQWQRLHQDAKTAALNGLVRLKMLEEEMRWLAPLVSIRDRGDQQSRVTGLGGMEALSVLPAPDAERILLKGHDLPPRLTADQARHLGDTGVLLMSGRDAENWIIVQNSSGMQAAARVSTASIFGLGVASSLPAEDILCLRSASAHVVCSDGDAGTAVAVATAALPDHGQATLTLRGMTHFARTWALPLQAEYHAGVWTTIMLAPQAAADATLRQLQRDVVLLTASALAVVILAVLASVRRNLQPLEALESAASKLSRQDFDIHLEVTTGDEFETLAAGFNGMVRALRAHVEDIESFSVGAATALARTIDAKSPWTAGHSERVTAMALAIARTLGLPQADLIVLQRGGLLHDIGKLATPSHILDKPGRLTPEERAAIEQHPRDGVRILEPISQFMPLLPIVLEHHERVDGKGYPDGKSGHTIHHLARVLAVADVYDALVSDRPYRAGLAHSAAIDIIKSSSGTHFDRDVVEAFLKVVAAAPLSALASQHAADSVSRASGAAAQT